MVRATRPLQERFMPNKFYCTGYWRLDHNEKHSPAHYDRTIPRTMRMLQGARVHVFCGDCTIEAWFVELARDYKIDISTQVISLSELPARLLVAPIVSACAHRKRDVPLVLGSSNQAPLMREKGDIHFFRDYLGSGPEVYWSLLSIWTSKIVLVSSYAREFISDLSADLAWVDSTISRFTGARSNWDFRRQPWPKDRVGHYSSPMKYRGEILPLNASFICAPAQLWARLESAFLKALEECCFDGYAHDEETILSHVIDSEPELFYSIGRPTRGISRLFCKISALGG